MNEKLIEKCMATMGIKKLDEAKDYNDIIKSLEMGKKMSLEISKYFQRHLKEVQNLSISDTKKLKSLAMKIKTFANNLGLG